MNIKIFAMTHRAFDLPTDPLYQPLQVGHALHEDLGYPADDTGDNISHLNGYYSELTGVYWVWKNVTDADYVGICHYRRYLLNEQGYIFTKKELSDLLDRYDILTSMKLDLNFSYAYGFAQNHSPEDLSAADRVIRQLYPDFYTLYAQRLQENHTYFGNIMICSKKLFDEYCQFLFPIFQQMHPLLDLDSYDDYHKRLYGFLSEFLLMVWCEYRQLKVRECKVGLIGEKKETSEVIHRLLSYFKHYKIADAKAYFLSVQKSRPDILMEASDISGRLHLCLQIISTCEYEQDAYGTISFPLSLDENALFSHINQLNRITTMLSLGSVTLDSLSLEMDSVLQDCSDYAIAISIRLYGGDSDKQEHLRRQFYESLGRSIPPLS